VAVGLLPIFCILHPHCTLQVIVVMEQANVDNKQEKVLIHTKYTIFCVDTQSSEFQEAVEESKICQAFSEAKRQYPHHG